MMTRDEQFEALMAKEGAALRRVAAAYASRDDRRNDLFQEIAVAIWTALPRFRGQSSLRTFAFRIAHNQGLRHATRDPVRRMEPLEAAPESSGGPDPQTAAIRRQEARRLYAAIRELPLVLRQAIVLQLEGLATREIAEVLGTSENGVLIRLSRARSALRLRLEEGRR